MSFNQRFTPDELVKVASIRLFREVTDMHGKVWLIFKHDPENEAVCSKACFEPLSSSPLSDYILTSLKEFYSIKTDVIGVDTISRAYKDGMEYIAIEDSEAVAILALAVYLESN